jgi:hypothetical protein
MRKRYQTFRRPLLISVLLGCALVQLAYLIFIWTRTDAGKSKEKFLSPEEVSRRQEHAAKLALAWERQPTLKNSQLTEGKLNKLFAKSCSNIPSDAAPVASNELRDSEVDLANRAFSDLMSAYMSTEQVSRVVSFNARRDEYPSETIHAGMVDELVGNGLITKEAGTKKTTAELFEIYYNADGRMPAWNEIVDGSACRSFFRLTKEHLSGVAEPPTTEYRDAFRNAFYTNHVFAPKKKSEGPGLDDKGMLCCQFEFVAVVTGKRVNARFPMCLRLWFDSNISQWRSLILIGSRTSNYGPFLLF